MNIAEEVYDSLLGETVEAFRLSWVENAFAPGSRCAENYEQMLQAYERLCARLGCGQEDVDVEIIINSLLDNQKELCLKMFAYGLLYQKQPRP